MSGNGDGPRLVITENDHAGLVVVVTAIAVAWTLMVLVIRLVTKLHVKATLGLEEIGIITASGTAVASSCAVFVGIAQGLGKKEQLLQPNQAEKALKSLYISDLLYIIALGIAKCGALPLIQSLTPIRHHKIACYILATFTICWMIVSTVLVGVRCNVQDPWNDTTTARCDNLFAKWTGIESISIFIELSIFALSVSIIYILKMRWNVKIKVIFAFATRLPVIVLVALRLKYLHLALNAPASLTDSTFTFVSTIITTQVVLHWTVMAASFAYLKPFLSAFDSNLGATVNVDTLVSSRNYSVAGNTGEKRSNRNNSTKYSSTFAMKPLGRLRSRLNSVSGREDSVVGAASLNGRDQIYGQMKNKSMRKSNPSATVDDFNFGLEEEAQTARGTRTKGDIDRTSSTDSKLPIITKTQEWEVHTEDRNVHD